MLSGLLLENFKAFGDRQYVPLAPITLIFGANSAGKSSILQSLLLLKQTFAIDSPEILLLPKGPLTDLGNFREMVHRHDATRTCEITPLLSADTQTTPLDDFLFQPYHLPEAEHGLGFRFGFDVAMEELKLVSLPYYFADRESPAFVMNPTDPPEQTVSRRHAFSPSSRVRGSYTRFVAPSDINSANPLLQSLLAEFRSTRLSPLLKSFVDAEKVLTEDPDQASTPFRNALLSVLRSPRVSSAGRSIDEGISPEYFLALIRKQMKHFSRYTSRTFISDTNKINRHRKMALRTMLPIELIYGRRNTPTGETLIDTWIDRATPLYSEELFPNLAQETVSLAMYLRQAFEDMVYLGPLRDSPERNYIFSGNVATEVGKSGRYLPDILFKQQSLVDSTNTLMRQFEIGYTLQVRKVPDIEEIFSLRLIDERSATAVSMVDVGFGISQVLPVIVQSMLSRDNIILIEQPEIHLHPRLQAHLGTLFFQGFKESGNQFIVETHSEHLILRLQKLLREGLLAPSDISVIYVTKDEQGSHCVTLPIGSNGEFLQEWPEGFFEEAFNEVFG